MARRRIMELGPTVPGGRRDYGRAGRITTSVYREPARRGVFLRVPPGTVIGESTTTKSQLRRKVIKGIEPPGQQPYNYPSATN